MSKTIFLKQLVLKNFKGIKDLTIDFSKITNIYGENATGKTTIFDDFTWLLLDKDSQDRSKFDVQPLDINNYVVHILDAEVFAIVEIDSIRRVLKKVLSEKWAKKCGEVEAELKGTESSYYVDEVPFKQGEYKNKIKEITGDEDVINYNDKLGELRNLLKPNEDIDSLSKRVKAQKAKLKKDRESIPARVDEINRTMTNDIDFNIPDNIGKRQFSVDKYNQRIMNLYV